MVFPRSLLNAALKVFSFNSFHLNTIFFHALEEKKFKKGEEKATKAITRVEHLARRPQVLTVHLGLAPAGQRLFVKEKWRGTG